MRLTKSVFLVIGLLFIAFAAMPLFAQTSGTGAIAGTVSDSTGAVIPGATVTATNAATGQERTVSTGADGTYKFGLLQPGVYNIKFTANGFKVTEVPNLTVAVTETPVLDQKLELGTQAEQVTVEANAEAIQTTNATLGTVVGGTQITALPLSTRNYTNILALSAGVASNVTNAGLLGRGGSDMAANGAGNGQNNIQIDGANMASNNNNGSNTDAFNSNAGSTPIPSPDSLQEFKVQTSSYDAGSGRNAGANVNVITKSGTNTFHGSAFEFFRNTVLNANDFFLNRGGKGKGVLNQNQYGGTIGGPIRKDKLFFFGSFQDLKQKNGLDSHGNSALTLPPIPLGDRSNTAAFQAALGSAFCPANHPGLTQYQTNTKTGLQVACDGSNINPVSIAIMQTKMPDGSFMFPSSPTGNFLTTNLTSPARFRETQELGNVDYIMSNKHTLAVRFFNAYAPGFLPFDVTQATPGWGVSMHYQNLTGLVKVTSVLTPALVNEVRISGHRDIGNFDGNTTGISAHQFGITPLSPLDYILPGFFPIFAITGAYSVGANGILSWSYTASNSYQAADQISWTHGKHTVRTGFEIEQIRHSWNYIGEGSGTVNIPSFADFLIGRQGCDPVAFSNGTCSAANPGNTAGQANSSILSTGSSDQLGTAGDPHQWHTWTISGFVNDDIKVNSRLTVNLGLRWEYDGMGKEIYGVQTDLWHSAIWKVPVPGDSPATGTLAGWVVPSNYKGTILPGLTQADNPFTIEGGIPKGNFAPRFGFAWQPLGGNKFVVRGGYGFFYDRQPIYVTEFGINNGPPIATPATHTGVGNYLASVNQPWFRNAGVDAGPPMYGTYPLRWANFAALTTSGMQQQSMGPDWQTPVIYSYNLGTQWNFLPSWVLETGYVGSHGFHEPTSYNVNSATVATQANPIWGLTTNTVSNSVLRAPYLGFGVLSTQGAFNAHKYNSLQVTLRKQFSHGVQAQASYTWNRQFNTSYDPNPGGITNIIRDYQVSGRPQRLSLNYSWNLPFGNPKGVLGKLVTGWNLSGVTTIQAGSYMTISDGRGGTIFSLTTSRAQIAPGKTYADIATPGGVTDRLGGNSGGCGYFTSAAVAGTLDGTTTCASLSPFVVVPNMVVDGVTTNATGQGNMGAGVIRGPGQLNFDASLAKMTKVGGLREDATLQFRAEFFNAFNHPQFGNPTLTDNTSTFGQITSTTVNPRVIQLALKYVF